jgi:hypothetical protein
MIMRPFGLRVQGNLLIEKALEQQLLINSNVLSYKQRLFHTLNDAGNLSQKVGFEYGGVFITTYNTDDVPDQVNVI